MTRRVVIDSMNVLLTFAYDMVMSLLVVHALYLGSGELLMCFGTRPATLFADAFVVIRLVVLSVIVLTALRPL